MNLNDIFDKFRQKSHVKNDTAEANAIMFAHVIEQGSFHSIKYVLEQGQQTATFLTDLDCKTSSTINVLTASDDAFQQWCQDNAVSQDVTSFLKKVRQQNPSLSTQLQERQLPLLMEDEVLDKIFNKEYDLAKALGGAVLKNDINRINQALDGGATFVSIFSPQSNTDLYLKSLRIPGGDRTYQTNKDWLYRPSEDVAYSIKVRTQKNIEAISVNFPKKISLRF